ncbi:MAG: ABC transporter permease [Phycisphaerae bacterium]|jgi:putative ABC transport system permease protein
MNIYALKGTVKLGIKSLWMHRLRSILTTLGIVFGVASVIAMLAIGAGASKEAQDAIARLGSTNLIIETVRPPQEQGVSSSTTNNVLRYGLTYKDAEAIRETLPQVQVAVPVREIPGEARCLTRQATVSIIGTVPWYTEIAPVQVESGRFLSSTDVNYQLSVCVIDSSLAQRLFMFEEPLGKYIRIAGNYYLVIGTTQSGSQTVAAAAMNKKEESTSSAQSGLGKVYIPVTTARSRFSEVAASFGSGGFSVEWVELQKIIVKVPNNDEVLPTFEVLSSLLTRLHEKQDYKIIVPLELLREAERTTRVFSIVLGSIAAISLLVGGIGIMNIMLATVSERTREIGIRRALGAKKRDIITQFLAETLLLTLAGGIIGIVVGSVIPFLVTKFAEMATVITGSSLLLAFGISALIGLTFGLYPAWHAANMNPIESLRHE